MADDHTRTDDVRTDERPPDLLQMPEGAQKLTTIGMAQKKPGLCACGEHPDPDAHDHAHEG